MKTPLTLALATALASSGAAAFERTIPYTDEIEDITVSLWSGTIAVEPGTDKAIVISGDCDSPPPAKPREDGLRVIGARINTPEILDDDDEITVNTRENSAACQVTVKAPPTVSVELRILTNGGIRIRDWQASVSAWSATGDVTVENQAATFSVAAMSGTATVSLAPGAPDGESAVLSAGGPLRLYLADGPLPNLRVQARWGDVLGDEQLESDFKVADDSDGRWYTWSTDPGGPVVSLRSIDDDIIIRRGKP